MNCIPIKIDIYLNNKGITNLDTKAYGDFSGVGSSYLSDELPNEKHIVVNNIPFIFQNGETSFDNMDFHNQEIVLPMGNYKRVHVLGASENGSFAERIELLNSKTGHKTAVKLGLTEWVYLQPTFGEQVAFRTRNAYTLTNGKISGRQLTVWQQSINTLSDVEFDRIVVGDNPGTHMFSLTMEKG